MHSRSNSKRLFSVKETAERLCISLRSMRMIIALKKIPIVRVTKRRVAIAEDDLAAYIAHRRG